MASRKSLLAFPELYIDKKELIAEFKRMDKDKSGTLDKMEIRLMIKSKGFPEAYVEAFIKKYDSNNDGKISLDEYHHLVKTVAGTEFSHPKIRNVYQKMQATNEGRVDERILYKYLVKYGNPNLKESDFLKIFQKYDKHKKGYLDIDQFMQLVKDNK